MRNHKKHFVLTVINIALFTLSVIFHFNPVFSIKILEANPIVPLALLVTVSLFCSHLTAAMAGLAMGICFDVTSATPQGFHAILFMILALAVSLTAHYLFNNNIFSAVVLCAIVCCVYFILRWLFCLAFSLEFVESLSYLMRYALPSTVYTCVFILPFYYLEKHLYSKLSNSY